MMSLASPDISILDSCNYAGSRSNNTHRHAKTHVRKFQTVATYGAPQTDKTNIAFGGNKEMARKLLATQAAVSLTTGMMIAASVAMSLTASAGEMPTAAEITSAVSDHTYQGSMTEAAFAEYYQADGTIKGKDYSGKWRVVDNAMCFQYGDKPEKCWEVEIDGPAMTMFKDGNVDGNGMLIEGNPHNF